MDVQRFHINVVVREKIDRKTGLRQRMTLIFGTDVLRLALLLSGSIEARRLTLVSVIDRGLRFNWAVVRFVHGFAVMRWFGLGLRRGTLTLSVIVLVVAGLGFGLGVGMTSGKAACRLNGDDGDGLVRSCRDGSDRNVKAD